MVENDFALPLLFEDLHTHDIDLILIIELNVGRGVFQALLFNFSISLSLKQAVAAILWSYEHNV